MNRPVTNTEIETVIKNLPTNKSPGPDGFTGKFYQAFSQELTAILLKLFQKIAEGETLASSLYAVTIIPKAKISHTKKEIIYQFCWWTQTQKFSTKYLQTESNNTLKKNTPHDPVEFIPGMQEFFNISKWINVVYHINKLNNKKNIIISTD